MEFQGVFRKISDSFKVEFTELSAEIDHNLTAGEAREAVLISLLQKYLPKRVGVDRGFVIDARGNQSLQIDVVIYDNTVGSVFEVAHTKFFPCETVLAVGEVKSDLASTAKLNDSLEKIRSVKALDRGLEGKNRIITGPGLSINGIEFDPANKHRDQIFGFIFTASGLTKDNMIAGIQEFNSGNDRRVWMNMLCDVERFLISYECESALYPSAMDSKYLYCTNEEDSKDVLLLFYTILATFINEAHVARPNYFEYGKIEKTDATYHDLTPPKV